MEDNPDLRILFASQLESESYEVITAVDGADGLQKVYEHTPDIVLCDLMMPNLDGREVLKHLKSDAQTSMIPVVMLTASDDEDNELELLDLGASDFISKLSSTEILFSRLRKVCRASG